MIMGDGGKKPALNPFSKTTMLRGFNNTPENIRNQMANAQDPWHRKSTGNNAGVNGESRSGYDPSKQRERMIGMRRLK